MSPVRTLRAVIAEKRRKLKELHDQPYFPRHGAKEAIANPKWESQPRAWTAFNNKWAKFNDKPWGDGGFSPD